jgi:hypothetical protein
MTGEHLAMRLASVPADVASDGLASGDREHTLRGSANTGVIGSKRRD